jgi:YcxB-like protein
MHHATLRYSETLLRSAVGSFVFRAITRRLGTTFILAIAAVVGITIYLLAQNDRSWVIGFLSATVLFAGAFIAAVFLAHYRNTIDRFRQMRSPEVTLAYDEQQFTLTSELGSATMPWSAITEVWRYPHYWLLIFSPSQFVTLPIDCLDQNTKDFISRKTRTQ